jgi:hypothetical protein
VHKNARVFCNLPALSTTNATTKFERIKYYELEWQRDHTTDAIRHGDFNKYVEINCHMPGSFNYYFTFNENKESVGGSSFWSSPNLGSPMVITLI